MKKKKSKGKRTRLGLIATYLGMLVFFCGMSVLTYYYVNNSRILSILTLGADQRSVSDGDIKKPVVIKPAGQAEQSDKDQVPEFPRICYRDQWATVNVEGWETKDVAVYYADNDDMEVLREGAVTPGYSEFCGRGRTVMAGHVNDDFREIEDTEVGTRVYVSTIYGEYIYQVDDIVIFDQDDNQYVYPDRDLDELVMYTCYPFDNDHKLRTQRIALICSMTEGYCWDQR